MNYSRLFPIIPALALSACATDQQGVRIETVEVVREVQKPCAGVPPVRPAPLAKPLPSDAVELAKVLALKLLEFAGPGKYADRAEAYFETCKTGE